MKNTSLGETQSRILKLLFKFRFITNNQLAETIGIKRQSTHEMLTKLKTQGYIDSRFNPTYRIDRRSAEYFVNKQGINYLKDKLGIDKSLLHPLYYNKNASEDFIKQCLSIADVYISLNKTYPDGFNIATKQEVRGVEGFIEPCPDLYLMPKSKAKKEYCLDDMSSTQLFITKKRIKKYIEHYESDDWDGDTYPTVLLVLNSPGQEQTILKFIENQMDANCLDETDMNFMVTTKNALRADHPERKVWTTVGSEKLKSL